MAREPAPVDPDSDEAAEIRSDFDDGVNMTPKALREWLGTEESESVGQKEGDESVGHEMGRHIVDILEKRKGELTAEDLGRMKKVNGYIARHSRQRPDGDVTETRWRYSLMNWGHDPLK
jgi:hypothetical protein